MVIRQRAERESIHQKNSYICGRKNTRHIEINEMYRDLKQYIERLEKEGELVRIEAKVDPMLEIAEITDRESKKKGGGRALLFENTGTEFPVVTNIMGSHRRVAMALGVETLEQLAERIDEMIKKVTSPKQSLADKMKMIPLIGEVAKWLPKTIKKRGECQQIIKTGDDADLGVLPILKCWPHDGGRFVTLPMVNTIDPDTGIRNVGMYRMQVTSKNTTGMHWHMHKTGERHYKAYQKRAERMPISVCLGGDPAYTYAATAPMPDNMDEYMLAGFIRGKSVKLVKCITNDIYVPADCDIVIEGYVDPMQEKFVEGPFGDHTGFYSLEDLYPEFHVTAITHRKDAIYPATIVGVPPQEDAYIAAATEKIFAAPIKLAMQPEMVDMYMPPAGVAHNIAMISIDKTYPAQGLKVATSMWGAGQMMFNKFMVITTAQNGVREPGKIAELLKNADIEHDTMIARGVLDVLDHSAEVMGTGGKMAIDLTTKREAKTVEVPDRFIQVEGVEGVEAKFAKQWGVIVLWSRPEAEPDMKLFLAQNSQIKGVNYIAIVDAAARNLEGEELLWMVAQNTEPQRDIKIMKHSGQRVMVVDGRSKIPHREGYPERMPNVVTSSIETIELVDRRWEEYKIGERIESPSRRYLPLLMGDAAQAKIE